MSYSLDLRIRVINYIEAGGTITDASRKYEVGRATIYRWLGRDSLEPTKVKRRKRKIDLEALKKDVEENPDKILKERAQDFDVCPTAIYYALKKINVTRNKDKRYCFRGARKKRDKHQQKGEGNQ